MKNPFIVLLLLLVSCQQGVKQKNIPETKVQQIEIEGSANSVDTLQTHYSSALRPNELLFLNTIYTDTLEFIDYNDDYDYRYLLGLKNDKEVSLTYNWDWFDNEEYNFIQGDVIAVQWKMDSIVSPGDGDTVEIEELALDAKKIASAKGPFQFLKRKETYDESVGITVSSLVINHSFLNNITPPEKAALAYISFDIGNECEWGYDSGGNNRVLWCQIVSALDLDHQCSEKQRSFLRKWFSKDAVALKKLENCPTLPNTATVQSTFDEILIQKDASTKTITVNYKVTGINLRTAESWRYNQTDVFEYGAEHILLVDSKKSDVTDDNINLNPDAAENIDPQHFVLALKDHILNEWKQQNNSDGLKITFADNVLNVKDQEGFTLSNYDFNEMVINGTDDPQIIYLTIGNEGGGGGGNVLLEETYVLTVVNAEKFEIKRWEAN